MSAEDFAGIGMAAGVVRGARSFKVDNLGRLTGIHYEQVWRPDENVAECRKRVDDWGTSFSFMAANLARQIEMLTIQPYATPITTVPSVPPVIGRKKGKRGGVVSVPRQSDYQPPKAAVIEHAPEPVEPKPHTMGECSCGFYGYYDGSDDYYKDGYVSAVVEGYGEALIGTRGFRVAKARIVALMIPPEQDRFANRIRTNYPGIPVFARFSDMVAEFPPDGGEHAVRPDTDDDFWTRKA